MFILWVAGSIAFIWTFLTLFAEVKGKEKLSLFGDSSSERMALLVYNPDLFYNLDEQVCSSFAETLAGQGWLAKVATVAAAEKMGNEEIDLYVFCANTYNWSPDWPTANYIKKHKGLHGKNAVAITLGSGSTGKSQRSMEEMLGAKDVRLLDSRSFWLLRPNDENDPKAPNVQVAKEQAGLLAKK
ncbi:MAG: hypothetical protein WBN18_00390, partial [Flavobacteriaceae bacterium]